MKASAPAKKGICASEEGLIASEIGPGAPPAPPIAHNQPLRAHAKRRLFATIARPHRHARFIGRDDQSICLALGSVESANVGELVRRTGYVQTTLSSHLPDLAKIGLVHSKRRGKYMFYRRDDDRLTLTQDADSFTLTLHADGLSLAIRAEREVGETAHEVAATDGAQAETENPGITERANE